VASALEDTWSIQMQNAQHWQEPFTRRQNAGRHRKGSPFSLTPKPPLGEWYRRTLAQARSMQSWQGGTSQHCGELARTSPLRSGSAPPTRVFQATRRPTSGQSSRRKARMRAEWNHFPGPLHTSSARPRRRNGQKHASGQETGSPKQSTRCRAARNRTEWSQVAPRGTPQGSTS
jgi:hypothetical protein